MNGRANVVVVDAQPLFSRGLELLLPAISESRVRVVGHTEQATLASALVRRTHPDVALVDLELPRPGGLRAIAAIRRSDPQTPVLALASGGSDSSTGMAALHAGALGVLEKTSEPEDLVMPLLAAVDGWAVLPKALLMRLLEEARHPAAGVLTRLTADERALWTMITLGKSSIQIAQKLHVSERTAKRLTAALLQRLRVSSRLEAAALAGRAGLQDQAG
jgi:two-component system, NarL family, nitrate/nitrite response regulator NarL